MYKHRNVVMHLWIKYIVLQKENDLNHAFQQCWSSEQLYEIWTNMNFIIIWWLHYTQPHQIIETPEFYYIFLCGSALQQTIVVKNISFRRTSIFRIVAFRWSNAICNFINAYIMLMSVYRTSKEGQYSEVYFAHFLFSTELSSK